MYDAVRQLLVKAHGTMRDTTSPQLAPMPSSRSQSARAFVRSRLVRIQQGPLCSCHPGGGHPTEEEPPQRDTVKIIRRRH